MIDSCQTPSTVDLTGQIYIKRMFSNLKISCFSFEFAGTTQFCYRNTWKNYILNVPPKGHVT